MIDFSKEGILGAGAKALALFLCQYPVEEVESVASNKLNLGKALESEMYRRNWHIYLPIYGPIVKGYLSAFSQDDLDFMFARFVNLLPTSYRSVAEANPAWARKQLTEIRNRLLGLLSKS